MIKLSFIVPVYNVAPYLRKCVIVKNIMQK